MSVHKKLMQARVDLQNTQLKKSGLNKFAGYTYFELGDFLPTIQFIFHKVGLCGVVSYTAEMATLTIVDTEDGTVLLVTSPMADANLKGTHPIQNLGAVETYQRRYLWMTALEIVEHDSFDSGNQKPAKAEPVSQPAPPKKIEGKEGAWQLKVTADPEGNFDDWTALVQDVTQLALDQVASEAEVMALFRNNKNIFDQVKQSAEAYASILAMFTVAKNQFKKDEE